MTITEFKAWLKGYLEGRADVGDDTDALRRIREEAEKIETASLPIRWDNQRLIGIGSPLFPNPGGTAAPDCGCLPGTTCMNTACPRAVKVTC